MTEERHVERQPFHSLGFVSLIIARVETLAQRPAFREALLVRRCLVAADGFYEWADLGGAKQPYHIGLPEGGPFAFAGLWERWHDPNGEALESCTLITTEAAPALCEIHARMPLIVSPQRYEDWLDPGRATTGKPLSSNSSPSPPSSARRPIPV